MIDLTQYTFEALLQAMLLRVSDDVNKREGSLLRTALNPAAWIHEGLYIELANVQNQAYGQTANGDYLDLIAEMRGIKRKQATQAIWKASFNIAPSLDDRFSARDTTRSISYIVTSEPVKQGSLYYCNVTCETAGTSGNEYNGALAPVTFMAGLTEAKLVSLESAGTDTETDESLRERWQNGLVEIAFAGNVAAYREFVLSIEGVGACMIFPTWDGPGTVCVSVIDSNYTPCLPAKIAEIQNLLCPDKETDGLGFAPIGASATVSTPEYVDIDVVTSIVFSGRPIEDIKTDIQTTIESYFESIRRNWGDNLPSRESQNIRVYCNAVLGRVMMIDGVVNVSSLFFYVNSEQITTYVDLIETGSLQQLPRLNTLTVSES